MGVVNTSPKWGRERESVCVCVDVWVCGCGGGGGGGSEGGGGYFKPNVTKTQPAHRARGRCVVPPPTAPVLDALESGSSGRCCGRGATGLSPNEMKCKSSGGRGAALPAARCPLSSLALPLRPPPPPPALAYPLHPLAHPTHPPPTHPPTLILAPMPQLITHVTPPPPTLTHSLPQRMWDNNNQRDFHTAVAGAHSGEELVEMLYGAMKKDRWAGGRGDGEREGMRGEGAARVGGGRGCKDWYREV